jgi:hypothetical protein
MLRLRLLFIASVIVLSGLSNSFAQNSGTLFSPHKHSEKRKVCLNFKTGLSDSKTEPCDLEYGLLGINGDFDWFQSFAEREDRSVIKDLGSHFWTDSFAVPAVDPLPKLDSGEQRNISIDVSGADGADGKPGKRGDPAGDALPSEANKSASDPGRTTSEVLPHLRPKNDGKPKIDPLFVKAIVGHMYVIHVVDENADFYALFRVDALNEGACNVSWKLIPAPPNQDE